MADKLIGSTRGFRRSLQLFTYAASCPLQAALPRVDGSPSPRSCMDSDAASSQTAGIRRGSNAGDERYGASLAAMGALRESLRQEHCCYLQVLS